MLIYPVPVIIITFFKMKRMKVDEKIYPSYSGHSNFKIKSKSYLFS